MTDNSQFDQDPEFRARQEAFYKLQEAVLQAFCKAYGIEDPRDDADGPDIEFSEGLSKAVHTYMYELDVDGDILFDNFGSAYPED